jgi:predicted  nucleic acid-binding Zn-ribbon protein
MSIQTLKDQIADIESNLTESMPLEELYNNLLDAYNLYKDMVELYDNSIPEFNPTAESIESIQTLLDDRNKRIVTLEDKLSTISTALDEIIAKLKE